MDKNDIKFNLLAAPGKKLSVHYDPKQHSKDQLMAKVGDALLSNGGVEKIDPDAVISRANIEVKSRGLLEQCKREMEQKKQQKQKKADERKKIVFELSI